MGVKQFLKLLSVGLMSAFYSVIAHAEYAWNFPAPATPMAADTLHVHNEFMLNCWRDFRCCAWDHDLFDRES